MDKAQVYELLNANPAFALATIDAGAPRVRGMLLYRADEGGIIFHTGNFKDVHKQLQADPRVEAYFFDPKKFTEIRINGVVEELTGEALKVEIANHPSRAFVKGWLDADREGFMKMFVVYRIKDAKACEWTMDKNMAPKDWFSV